MAGEFQNLGVALKVVYPNKALEAVINEEAPFRARLSKSVPAGAKVSQGTVKFNGVLALPQNVAQIFDGGALQDAGERSEVQFTLIPTVFQGTLNIGWLAAKAANTDQSAFNGGELRRRTNEVVGNLGKFIESTYVGTTSGGIRAYVSSSGVGGIVLASPEYGRLLRQGMKVSVRDHTSPTTPQTTLDAVRIASYNPSTYTITTTGTPTYTNAVAGDLVYVVPTTAFTLTSVFANGMRGLVDDGSNSQYIHGVDRTTVGNEKLKSIVNTSSTARDLTEAIMISICNDVRENSSKRVTDIFAGPGQFEKWIAFVAPDRRRAVAGGNYDKSTGIKSEDELVHYAPGVNAKLTISFDCIPGEMHFLCWDSWFHYVAQEMQWINEGGGMMKLGISTSTGYVARWDAFMASFENIGCDMPGAQAVARMLKDRALGS
jgi:hypothetical protein